MRKLATALGIISLLFWPSEGDTQSSGGGGSGAVASVTGSGTITCSPTVGAVVCTGSGSGGTPAGSTNALQYNAGAGSFGGITPLTSGQVLIGQASGPGAGEAISGDITITAAGVVTIGANAVTTTKINAAAVTYAKMQNGGVTGLLETNSGAAPSELTPGTGVLTGLAANTNTTNGFTTFGTDCPIAGCTYTGAVITKATATGSSGFNLPPGTAPTSPNNGDLWSTSAGVFAQVAGATVGPFGTGGGSTAFSALTSGTNSTATMTLGAGGALTFTSTGVVNANELGGVALLGGTLTDTDFCTYASSGTLLNCNTGSTGLGNVVLASSPTLVTPALGTPGSGTLTNTTGFPAGSLAGSTLASGVTGSSLTTVGTVTGGTWESAFGGTITGNATLSGNLTLSGTDNFTGTFEIGGTSLALGTLTTGDYCTITTGSPNTLNCNTSGSSGTISVSGGGNTATGVSTLAFGNGFVATPNGASGGTGTVNLSVPFRTVTSSPTIGSGDLGGVIYSNVSGGGTLTIPAVGTFVSGASVQVTNYSASTEAISTTPTVNAGGGCVSGTGIPSGDTWFMSSNGTSIDCVQTTPTSSGGSGISGLTTGQLGIAGSATTLTSSIAYGTTGSGTIVETGGSGFLAGAILNYDVGAGEVTNCGTSGSILFNNSSVPGCDTSATLSTGTLSLGASGTLGDVVLGNATSGTVTLEPVTGALGSVTASLPANTGTIAETNLAQSFTAAQTFAAVNGGDNVQSGSTYTIAASDCGKTLVMTGSSPVVTLAASVVPASGTGCQINFIQAGSTKVSLNGTAVSAATLESAHSYTGTSGTQYSMVTVHLTTISSTTYAILEGDGS